MASPELHKPVETFLDVVWPYDNYENISRQFPIRRTNSRGHTTITDGSNDFGPKSSFQTPKINASFKALDLPPEKAFFWGGGSVSSDIFFNFGDTTLLQNMKNIKSKFLNDLKYFSQHLVNTWRFYCKWNLKISENCQKMHNF